MIKKKEEWIVMGKAPERCPMCGEQQNWKLVDVSKKGFSVGKAAVGAVLLGPIGGRCAGKEEAVLLLRQMRL